MNANGDLFISDFSHFAIRKVTMIHAPTGQPSRQPTMQPSSQPTQQPTTQPISEPTQQPTMQPSTEPTMQPSSQPTQQPTLQPFSEPTQQPTMQPSTQPTMQPFSEPSSAPSYVKMSWDVVETHKRHRKGGQCDNSCSMHGTCEKNYNCKCYTDLKGEPEWTGPDCSLRTCPKDVVWVGQVVNANNLHPWEECSNRGLCDRKTGLCGCFPGYEGVACQRSVCPMDCNGQGICLPETLLAARAGRVYSAPWDAGKAIGCVCDPGFRGPACDQRECPSGPDPLDGYGNEAGRDCSGRGLCDYSQGTCSCFSGFYGSKCQHQTALY